MPEFRHIPEMVKKNGIWVFDEFVPTQGAFDYENHAGKKGTLYAVACHQFTKIGISRNFASRLKQIDTGTPFPVKTIATREIPSSALAYAEAWLHNRFKEFRVKGEWFDVGLAPLKNGMAAAVRRAYLYESYCREWHIEEMADRQSPERQEKMKKEYEEFLKRKVEYA